MKTPAQTEQRPRLDSKTWAAMANHAHTFQSHPHDRGQSSFHRERRSTCGIKRPLGVFLQTHFLHREEDAPANVGCPVLPRTPPTPLIVNASRHELPFAAEAPRYDSSNTDRSLPQLRWPE